MSIALNLHLKTQHIPELPVAFSYVKVLSSIKYPYSMLYIDQYYS